MDIIEDIKNRISIEDLVAQYVQLKKTGRNFKGLCPFHQEKTPSFIVSPEKQIAYCFGCNKGGDIFKFLQEIEGISFVEAINVLAEKCGINTSAYASLKKDSRKEEKEILINAISEVNDFYKSNLKTGDEKKAFDYLLKRGLREETIETFEIGYAPDSFDATTEYMVKKGIEKSILAKSGLLATSTTESGKFYDKFRGRVIFPIRDHLGRVIGFGGRTMKKDDVGPKYLNSPETPIYHKSDVLYGLFQSKSAIKEKDSAIVVEGYMDTVMCFQGGYKNVVASSGTALTQNQLKLLKRYTQNLYFAFDMDEAGFEATKRAYINALDLDMNVKVVSIAEKDPADCIKGDPKVFEKALSSAKPFMEFYFDRIFKKFDSSDISGRQSIFSEVLPFLKIMTNKVHQDFYVRMFANLVSMKESKVYDEISRLSLPSTHPSKTQEPLSTKVSVSDLFLGFLLEYPDVYETFGKNIDDDDFSGLSKNIYKVFIANYNAVRQKGGIHEIGSALSMEEREKAILLSLYVSTKYEDFSRDNVNLEVDKLFGRMREARRGVKKLTLQKRIKESYDKGDKKEYLELLSELQRTLQ